MSIAPMLPIAGDISSIRENYDTDNPVVAEILKAKEERLKIFQQLNEQHQEQIDTSDLLLDNVKADNSNDKKNRKSECNNSEISLRRSTRIKNSPKVSLDTYKIINYEHKSHVTRPPNDYGSIPGVEIGCHWETRMECSMDGVHRPTVAGIHGGPDGAYSIALSGGYPEDIDDGHTFIYTGAGGRDLKGTATKPKNLRTAPQTKDQQLEGTNLSLVRSIESKLPVRVIRGYKSPSIFAPETGYRYDGLYQVVSYWEDVGKTGHRIYRFRMERMKNQPPAPWETTTDTFFRPRNSGERDRNFQTETFSDIFMDESDFKENIPPGSEGINLFDNNYDDLDEEIRNCIEYFVRTEMAIRSNEDFTENSAEEEFHGWDEQ